MTLRTGSHMHSAHESPMEDYFSSPAERLVIEGYRLTALGLGQESVHSPEADPTVQSAHDAAWLLYRHLLDEQGAWTAFEALSEFVGALGRCAACPLRSFTPGMRNLTRDEVLIVGLISAIQHGDEMVAELCLSTLACPTRCAEIEAAASVFAITLRGFGRKLHPIPLNAVEDVLVRSNTVTIH